jgi:hypothetical protein
LALQRGAAPEEQRCTNSCDDGSRGKGIAHQK